MRTMTKQTVVCAWCGSEGAGICPDCAEAQVKAEKYLEALGKHSQKNLRRAMGAYLTSRWADKIDGRWVCGLCGVEALVLGPECPVCGCRGRESNG